MTDGLTALGYRNPRLAGRGLEHAVWAAESAEHGPVAIKIPLSAVHSNANDQAINGAELLDQEYRLTRHLFSHGIPVAKPIALIDAPFAGLVSAWVPSASRAHPDQASLASLISALQAVPVPQKLPMAHEGESFEYAVRSRTVRRWSVLQPLLSDEELPTLTFVVYGPECLLHLDFRADNFRLDGRGRVVALLDWSNSMVGPRGFELARALEYARYPSNGLQWNRIIETPALKAVWNELPETVKLSYQLDSAVMLAVLFNFELANAPAGRPAIQRVAELTGRLRATMG